MAAPLGALAVALSVSGVAGAATTTSPTGWHDPTFLVEIITSLTGLITGVGSLVMALRNERREDREPEVVYIERPRRKHPKKENGRHEA